MSDWLDWLETIGDNHGGAITALGLGVAFVAMVFAGLALRKSAGLTRLDHLRDHHTWPDLLASLTPSAATAYFTGIARVSGFARRIYGERLFSWRAFDRALLIAFLYPIAALLLGWVFFDAGQLGGAKFMPEGLAWGRRVVAVVLIVLAGGAVFLVSEHRYKITAGLNQLLAPLRKKFDTRPGFLAKAGRVSVRVIAGLAPLAAAAFAFAFAGVVSGALAFAGAGAVAFAGAFVVAVAFSGAVAVAVAVAFAGAVAVAVAVADAEPKALANAATFFLFLTLLPLLNACADFLSVAATRWFLRHIAPGPGKPQGAGSAAVVLGVVADLALAALCLAGLVWSITATLDLWARLHPASLPLDWRAYRTSLCAGDLGRGTMLWLMLVTTLLPTAVHLAAGFAALLTRNARIDGAIHALLAPAAQALEARHGQTVWQIDPSRRWDEVLSTADLGRLDTLCAKRSWLRTGVFLGLLVLALAALIGAVAGAGALISPLSAPLCPAAA